MMHVHLVLVGSLFFWPLMGIDPVPGRVAYPFRMLLVVMTLPFHAFLGVTIMGASTLIGEEWYAGSDRARWARGCPRPPRTSTWPAASCGRPGDLVGLVFFAVLFAQWVRASTKEAAREDRRLDRLEAAARARPPE